MNHLLEDARGRLDGWLSLLEALVSIDSGPGDHEGVARVYDVVGEMLAELGFAEQERLPTGGPDVFVARREAGTLGARRLLLIGHADTVFPAGTVAERPFARDGDQVTGPGVADMKAGIVVAIGGLELAGSDVLDRYDITFLLNGDEESGSYHSRETIEQLAPGFDLALVFEPGRPPNLITTARRGAHRFRIVVHGKAAHTGVNPQDGANAIEAAAHHVLAIQELGRSIPGATVNAVIIEGGKRPNIIPDHCVIRVDSRFDTAAVEKAVVEGVYALAGEGPVPGTTTEVISLDQRPAFEAADAGLEALYGEVASELGFEIRGEKSGGSSDGNFMYRKGVPVLDGLGAVGYGYHTVDEYVLVDTIAERAATFAGLLHRLGDGTR